jgi:hypothetical protein
MELYLIPTAAFVHRKKTYKYVFALQCPLLVKTANIIVFYCLFEIQIQTPSLSHLCSKCKFFPNSCSHLSLSAGCIFTSRWIL